MSKHQSQGALIAGLGRRVLAGIIDFVLLFAAFELLGWLILRDIAFSIGPWGRLIGLPTILLYLGLCNSALTKGQTIGKRFLGIAVVGTDGNYLSVWRSMLRACIPTFIIIFRNWAIPPFQFQPVDLILDAAVWGLVLAWLYGVVFNRATRQGIHDLVVGSSVILTSGLRDGFSLQCSSHHKKVTIGLLVLGVLVSGVGSVLVGGLLTSAVLGDGETVSANETLDALVDFGQAHQVETALVTTGIVGQSQITQYLRIEIWSKNACRRDFARCQAQIEDVVAVVLDKYVGVEQLYGIEVKLVNRFDMGLATGHLTWTAQQTIDNWHILTQ